MIEHAWGEGGGEVCVPQEPDFVKFYIFDVDLKITSVVPSILYRKLH